MNFERPLVKGRLIKRYKRFMADVELTDGSIVTAHCANPGAMEGLAEPQLTVWLSKNDNPKRKLAYSWELVEFERNNNKQNILVGINTAHPNRLAHESLMRGQIVELTGYDDIKTEVKYGENSRVDLLLSNNQGHKCYVEVKNAHLMRTLGLAEFPDSPTTRGTKHLRELSAMVAAGHRAVMFYVVQRNDADRFAIAADKDPAYSDAFAKALKAGVEVIVYGCRLSTGEIEIDAPLKLVDAQGK